MCGTEVSTSSRKTRKVTFLPRVATSVPSLVRSWRPLGARLGHFCRLGLNLRGAPSVQLFDKALRYLEFSPKKKGERDDGTVNAAEVWWKRGFPQHPQMMSCRKETRQAYPVVLRKVSPVVQSLDVAEGTNQNAGAQLPSICLSKP